MHALSNEYYKLLNDFKAGLPLAIGDGNDESGSSDSGECQAVVPVRQGRAKPKARPKKLRLCSAGTSLDNIIDFVPVLAESDIGGEEMPAIPIQPSASNSLHSLAEPKSWLSNVRVHGSLVSVEQHLNPSDKGHYFRLIVRCHCAKHWDADLGSCVKKRNVDLNRGRDGVVDAVAFLGTWIQQGASIPSREDHIKKNPGQQQQTTFRDVARIAQWDLDTIRHRP
jgi:hypothetical protein